MIALLQRVKEASVTVDGNTVGQSGPGLLIFLGVFEGDEEKDALFLANKSAHLRIFNDASGKMNNSVIDVGGSALVVSQFTLCADARKGRRPSYINAASPKEGESLYSYFVELLKQNNIPTETGIFGAMMQVSLTNDGPVTLILDSRLS
jgi:D-tyrosyl-tRNA(Tyr) deacylase